MRCSDRGKNQKKLYRLSDEELTPLPKSHDTGTGTGSQCVCVCEINVIHYYANNSFMLYQVNSYKAYFFE